MGFLDEFKRLAHPYEDEDDEEFEDDYEPSPRPVERRERERTNDLHRPRFDVPAPVREFRVELTLDHPYRIAFDARIAAPAFDRNYPRAEDYLKSYREQTEELHLLAAKLMHMIAPGAGETQSGFGWMRSMQMVLSRMPRTRAFLF